MSLGLGLFLSSLIFGIIWLYALTMNRWKWRRNIKRLGLGILMISSLAGLVVGGIYACKQIFPTGLRLGMTMAEVLHEEGIPNWVLQEDPGNSELSKCCKLVVDSDKLEKGQKVEDFTDWEYRIPSGAN